MKQGIPSETIGNLSTDETRALLAAIGTRESSNNYSAINQFGYVGKYQVGTPVLEDLGYIKKGTFAANPNNTILTSDSVWTGKDGINSRDDFIANHDIQDKVALENLQNQYKFLQAKNGISDADDNETVAGMLMTSHLLGAGGATTWRNTGSGKDANGTTGSEYYNIGVSVIAYANDENNKKFFV